MKTVIRNLLVTFEDTQKRTAPIDCYGMGDDIWIIEQQDDDGACHQIVLTSGQKEALVAAGG